MWKRCLFKFNLLEYPLLLIYLIEKLVWLQFAFAEANITLEEATVVLKLVPRSDIDHVGALSLSGPLTGTHSLVSYYVQFFRGCNFLDISLALLSLRNLQFLKFNIYFPCAFFLYSSELQSSLLSGSTTAWDLLIHEKNRRKIGTGSTEVDKILGGGVLSKELTEICKVLFSACILSILLKLMCTSVSRQCECIR